MEGTVWQVTVICTRDKRDKVLVTLSVYTFHHSKVKMPGHFARSLAHAVSSASWMSVYTVKGVQL